MSAGKKNQDGVVMSSLAKGRRNNKWRKSKPNNAKERKAETLFTFNQFIKQLVNELMSK